MSERIDVYHHVFIHGGNESLVLNAIAALSKKVDTLSMSVNDDFVALKAKVQTTVDTEDSAVLVMNAIKAKLDALAAQPTISQADVQALSAQLDAHTPGLAAAIASDGEPAA